MYILLKRLAMNKKLLFFAFITMWVGNVYCVDKIEIINNTNYRCFVSAECKWSGIRSFQNAETEKIFIEKGTTGFIEFYVISPIVKDFIVKVYDVQGSEQDDKGKFFTSTLGKGVNEALRSSQTKIMLMIKKTR